MNVLLNSEAIPCCLFTLQAEIPFLVGRPHILGKLIAYAPLCVGFRVPGEDVPLHAVPSESSQVRLDLPHIEVLLLGVQDLERKGRDGSCPDCLRLLAPAEHLRQVISRAKRQDAPGDAAIIQDNALIYRILCQVHKGPITTGSHDHYVFPTSITATSATTSHLRILALCARRLITLLVLEVLTVHPLSRLLSLAQLYVSDLLERLPLLILVSHLDDVKVDMN